MGKVGFNKISILCIGYKCILFTYLALVGGEEEVPSGSAVRIPYRISLQKQILGLVNTSSWVAGV